MTIDEFLTNVQRIQAADPRYRLGRDGSDGYCDCIGLVIGAIRRSGGQWRGIHGTNWTARNAMHDLNPLRGAGSSGAANSSFARMNRAQRDTPCRADTPPPPTAATTTTSALSCRRAHCGFCTAPAAA